MRPTFLQVLAIGFVAVMLSGCTDLDAPDEEEAAAAESASPAVTAPPPPPVCPDCGSVSSIEEVTEKGEATGAGAVGGAIIGGVIGRQFGGGRGKDLATVAGAAGGAYAGHEIEKRARSTTYYRVSIAMETGGTRYVNVAELNGLAVGSKVRVVGENLELL
jgi:outer membrane lipoprotein SlyB